MVSIKRVLRRQVVFHSCPQLRQWSSEAAHAKTSVAGPRTGDPLGGYCALPNAVVCCCGLCELCQTTHLPTPPQVPTPPSSTPFRVATTTSTVTKAPFQVPDSNQSLLRTLPIPSLLPELSSCLVLLQPSMGLKSGIRSRVGSDHVNMDQDEACQHNGRTPHPHPLIPDYQAEIRSDSRARYEISAHHASDRPRGQGRGGAPLEAARCGPPGRGRHAAGPTGRQGQ